MSFSCFTFITKKLNDFIHTLKKLIHPDTYITTAKPQYNVYFEIQFNKIYQVCHKLHSTVFNNTQILSQKVYL